MPTNDAVSRIEGITMPDYYKLYYSQLSEQTYTIFEKAAEAKSSLVDSSGMIEPKIAFDLADRVSKMHDIDISEPLRELLKINGKELSALIISKDIALGKYLQNATLEERLDLAVRVGLAVVTEGVTIAPLQGISDVSIKKNKDGSEYLSVSIAGPMRSAGGTESAVTMLIADHVRKTVNLSAYQANSFDDETGRFVEELRIYEREAGNFQFHVLDQDVVHVISHLPVELDGVDTDPFEVVNHKGMVRIKTNRVRGGALRVLNDGLIGRAKKLLKRIELYQLEGWDWLNELKGAIQKGEKEEDAATKRMSEVIAGRSVLSMPNRLGGFRLRYGRSCNTGFASIGIHPVIAEILDHTIAVGTQVKIDQPGKGATIAFVDSIETPIVRMTNGNVVKIKNVEHGIQIKKQIEKILHLGDILISIGDFIENNAQLVPTGYVEEYWVEELKEKLSNYEKRSSELTRFLKDEPTLEESIKLSIDFKMPLFPKYLHYWDQISHEDFEKILKPNEIGDNTISYPFELKPILEKLGVPHQVKAGLLHLEEPESKIFYVLLFRNKIDVDRALSVPTLISKYAGIIIRNKFSASLGVRIGRPEKASPRHMKPPIHTLFPVSENGGPTRDLLKASSKQNFYTNISNRICKECNEPSIGIKCLKCNNKTIVPLICPVCRSTSEYSFCEKCKRKTLSHSYKPFPLKTKLLDAQKKTGFRAQEPFKGVKELINQDKIAEPLEKGLLRQSFGLTAFKDGTVRFDATNSPLTSFKPSWIGTSIEKLHKLGYSYDKDGKPLTDPDQTVELRMQDIIIPEECARYLVSVCKYMDKLLEEFYNDSSYYKVKNITDLIGHLVVGLAPHTSVGILGRVIGYTNTHVCFATPNWHSAKRRDADGDADSIILLMDSLLNFSRNFLSDKIGGLMDAPLLVQPLVLPHESQPQAHNLEVVPHFSLEFFNETLENKKASEIRSVEIIKDRLETEKQFYNYHYTHSTSTLTTSKSRSAYSTLGSMLDKFDMQIKNAELIEAVDTSEIVSNVITTHLVPDIMGNLRAYARQSFRCTSCGRAFRRIPLAGHCICGNKLIQTITRASVEKYLKLAKRLVEKYNVSPYQKGRIMSLSDELNLVFGKGDGDQALLTDYR
ncbi:MAG: DNA polymerase II large subunit [Nitrosopumilaceae archaeon]|nr:DNA polymerase II large subunit [Nitrosopumilaceae archaeon]NIU00882.1 DNA polymerase II large subunit [Nitrosopumilaceae archaeon]NIU87335.1 DNA polymerase II large subunit [Nitrosopumilaceae archaeon]NIV65863.1 DNA polymerase II large subunit [Nitrosopumilaceae archaeon]NIX61484.1 DNA polymerase II large subunit [Nitrosopumilaceae archaeon]